MPILSKASTDDFDSPLERLLASIANLRQQPTAKGAHFYRTSLRRFQAWSEIFHPHIDAEQRQALKFLDKLRKATGKLRDSEVHQDLLDGIAGVKAKEKKQLEMVVDREKLRRAQLQLLDAIERRGDAAPERALEESLHVERPWVVLRVLDESPGQPSEPAHRIEGSAELALEEYRAFVQRRSRLSVENLHEYRLECKRFRYTAELAGDTPQAERLIEAWKTVQDVIGEWHDYLMLSEVVQSIFGNSALHTKLLQHAQKQYRESLRAVSKCERKLLASAALVPKKEPQRARSGRSSSRAA